MENFRSPLELLKEASVATANLERLVCNATQQMDELNGQNNDDDDDDDDDEDDDDDDLPDPMTTILPNSDDVFINNDPADNIAFSPSNDVFNPATDVFSSTTTSTATSNNNNINNNIINNNNNNNVNIATSSTNPNIVFPAMTKTFSTPCSSSEVYSTANNSLTSTQTSSGHNATAVQGGTAAGSETSGSLKKLTGMQRFQIITPDSEIGQQLQQHLLHCKQNFLMRRAVQTPAGVIGSTAGMATSVPTSAPTISNQGQLYQRTQVMSVPVKPKIPRPPNAFMIFANQNRKDLANKNPTESNKQISVRLGNMWKAMSKDQKEQYFSMAKAVDQEHKRRYPDYVYNPKEARIKKAIRDQTRESHRMLNYKSPSPTKRATTTATAASDVFAEQQYRKRGGRGQTGQMMTESMMPYESYLEVPYQPQGGNFGLIPTPTSQWFPYVQQGASAQWAQGWGFPSAQAQPRGVQYVMPGAETSVNSNNTSNNQGYVGYPDLQGEAEPQQSGNDNVDMPRNSGHMMPSDPLLYLQQQQQQSQQQQPQQQQSQQQQLQMQQQQQQQQATESSTVLSTLLKQTPGGVSQQQQQQQATPPGQQATPPASSQNSRMTPTTNNYRPYLGQTITSPTPANNWPGSYYYTFSPNTADTSSVPKLESSVNECATGTPYSCYPASSGQFYYNYYLPGQSEGETIYATSPEPRHNYQFQQATPTVQHRSKSQSQYILGGGGFPGVDASDREDPLYSECHVMDINNQEGKELTVSVSDHDMALKNGARVIASYEGDDNDHDDEFSQKLKKMKCEVDVEDAKDAGDPFVSMSGKTIPIPDNVDPSKIIHQNENVCVLTNDFVDDQLSCMTTTGKKK